MRSAETEVKPRTIQTGKLLRILGVTFGISVTIGGTIGVGILRTPGTVASQLGNLWLIAAVWLIGGVYAFLGTISVIELGTMLPKAGGWYVYARWAFGEYGGFVVGWSNWISYCTTLASLAIAFGEYSLTLVPALSLSAKTIAITTLILFSLLHWMGLRFGSGFQKITSFMLALSFLALVTGCFLLGGNGSVEATDQTFLNMPATFSAIFIAVVIALQSVLFTYDGWYGAIFFTEEDSNPARNLPRSMIGGVLAIITIYILVNTALFYVLPFSQLAASQFPAADAAQVIFGIYGRNVITAIALISILSVINATILMTTRVIFAMSRDQLFTKKAAVVNSGGTPGVALLVTTLAGILLVATGTFEELIAITTFFFVVMYGSGFISLFVLRKREPELPRPFKVWFYPWTTLIVLAISVVFLIGVVISDTINSIYAMVILTASYPIYLLMKKGRVIKKL